MQVFLPYDDYTKSLLSLDKRRQFKQVVEASQIINVIKKGEGGWSNHPATVMYKHNLNSLIYYYNIGLRIAIKKWKVKVKKLKFIPYIKTANFNHPIWLGYPKFHSQHRARLLSKKPEWYRQFDWKEQPSENYIWPIQNGQLINEISQWLNNREKK